MKKISAADAQKIQDFSLESELNLPAFILEKDLHVFDAIKILLEMPVNKHFRLVFCGGTCLSKAYKILERMSEDVDFKVVPTALARALTKSALRRELRKFRQSVVSALLQGGFTGTDTIEEKSRDEGADAALSVQYQSAFEKPQSLREHLLIELNYTELATATLVKEVGLLVDQLIGRLTPKLLKLECVSLEEALAEKMIAFPRRLGKHMADQLPDGDLGPKKFDDDFLTENLKWDKSLVRHLYDVSTLLKKHPELISDTAAFPRLLKSVMRKDAQDFKNAHADYRNDPVNELKTAMKFAIGSAKLRAQYDKFVSDMVYGLDVPSYDAAAAHFDSALKSVLFSTALPLILEVKTK